MGLVTIRKAAEEMGVRVQRVYELMSAGDLPYHRIGKATLRVRLEDINNYLQRTYIHGGNMAVNKSPGTAGN